MVSPAGYWILDAAFFLNHRSALFGTYAAGICTFPAMVHMTVFIAFFRASVADFHAEAAHFFGAAAAHAHELGGAVADGGAFHIQLNALGEHLYIIFLQTGGGAVVADSGASQASVDALLKFMIAHSGKFLIVDEWWRAKVYIRSSDKKIMPG